MRAKIWTHHLPTTIGK